MNSSIDASLSNTDLSEEMYAKYLQDPSSIDPTWLRLFSSLDTNTATSTPTTPPTTPTTQPTADIRVYDLINAYRTYGHLIANTNPLLQPTHPQSLPPQLKLETFNLKQADLQNSFPTYGLLTSATAPLSAISEKLQAIYCGTVGFEYMGLDRPELEQWLQDHLEHNASQNSISIDQKRMILQQLNTSELFEVFLHTKYVGQKRFSLEGAETLIPMLEAVLETGSQTGMQEFVIGMAHRGRLNVLSNILKKSHTDIFSEFDEGYIPDSFEGSGDVKYHKGYFSEVLSLNKKTLKVSLTPNPSHLESVDPVVEGLVKAKQLQIDGHSQKSVVPILIHGDAALAGQGVVYETLQLYNLAGYNTGGTLHFVVNNQIGFTTVPEDSRSTRYCTDIAHTFGAPVFHVNAEDPEACVYITNLAVEIRQKFHCDVFIDLICYRKYGHNESDEPAYTQPLEYSIIKKKQGIRELYRDHLIRQNLLEKSLAESLEAEFKKSLQEAQQNIKIKPVQAKEASKKSFQDLFAFIETGLPAALLSTIAERMSKIPADFKLHPKVESLVKGRLAMIKDNKPIDWGMAETLAYGTLLWEGVNVRLAGQDCSRGTFSHRHGLWVDQSSEKSYFPLQHLKAEQGRFDLINSSLSEFAALGFEYGYSVASPESLTIWEAQFGDFANSAQIIIDQYIASAEQKWGQKSGLTLLLPHGYEGQGPEHSSARLERFLTLCGNDNMQIVNPTTPSQLFHLLRRQILADVLKPLIVFTPKGLLRHPACVSFVSDLTKGSFETIIPDPLTISRPKKVIFCSGRIYYDLNAQRSKEKIDDTAIVRIEQLYPLDSERFQEVIKPYAACDVFYWVQEEPANMGAWSHVQPVLDELLPKDKQLFYIGRPGSASPAVGSHVLHKREYQMIMDALFKLKS